jgi:hypothetical protein
LRKRPGMASSNSKIGERERTWFGQRASNVLHLTPDYAVWINRHMMIAVTTMMLTAQVLGYDAAPMEGLSEDQVKSVLDISSTTCEWLRCSASEDAKDQTRLMRGARK